MSLLLALQGGGPPQQNITGAGGIASAEAFGAHQLGLYVAGVGNIGSAEVVGNPSLHFTLLNAGGVASEEAFGSAALGFVLPNVGAIPGAEAFGTPQIELVISVVGISGEEAFGTLVVTAPPGPSAIGGGGMFLVEDEEYYYHTLRRRWEEAEPIQEGPPPSIPKEQAETSPSVVPTDRASEIVALARPVARLGGAAPELNQAARELARLTAQIKDLSRNGVLPIEAVRELLREAQEKSEFDELVAIVMTVVSEDE